MEAKSMQGLQTLVIIQGQLTVGMGVHVTVGHSNCDLALLRSPQSLPDCHKRSDAVVSQSQRPSVELLK